MFFPKSSDVFSVCVGSETNWGTHYQRAHINKNVISRTSSKSSAFLKVLVILMTYFEENRACYREGGIGLESTGCTETKSSKKNLEEDG
jgi:hypothetical protein